METPVSTISTVTTDPSEVSFPNRNSEQRIDKSPKKIFPQVMAAFAASISAFGMGTVEAYTSPALPSMEDSPKLDELSNSDKANIASIALIAAILSGPQVGFMVGKVGRKAILAISALPFVVGWLLIASTSYFPMIYLGRFITGFCAGAASLVVPIYIGEISEDRYRGMLCSGFQVMVTLGNFFVFVLGTFIDWQWLAFVCGMVPLFGLLLMVVVPPTPTFLVSRGRISDASSSLMWLRGAKSSGEVEAELQSIQSNLKACKEERKSYKDFFKMRTIRPLSICMALLFFQQMTGIETILFYTVDIFEAAEVDLLDPNICTIIVGFLQILATILSAILVDKAGRRILLIISQLGASFSMLILVLFFHFHEDYPQYKAELQWIPLASLSCFIIFFAIGAGPVPFLMVAELNSTAVIGVASAVATTFNWTFACLASAFFMDIEAGVGLEVMFGVFSGFSFLGAVFVYIYVPETKGVSMEEIQNYFRGKSAKIKI